MTAVLAEALTPMTERLAKLEGSTVLRNDNDDAKQGQPAEMTREQKEIKRQEDIKSGAIFQGALGLGGRR